ncbi:DUF1450 domain-containing protein [Paenibacillus sp. FSL H8-0548]|uniref:DUF1450 domain-containing protein n=1 Tax=Paenibacillus sp. FSL H8-0548 TaxID=1920422 RepID=UPI003159FD3F
MNRLKKIKYCKRNLKNGLEPIYKAMKNRYPDIKQKKSDCLGDCRTCRLECFVVIKSKTVSAPSAEKLYKRLKKLIG